MGMRMAYALPLVGSVCVGHVWKHGCGCMWVGTFVALRCQNTFKTGRSIKHKSLHTSLPQYIRWCNRIISQSLMQNEFETAMKALNSPVPYTNCDQDKMPPFWQTAMTNAFSWMKMIELLFEFHWNVFPGVQLTISKRCKGFVPNKRQAIIGTIADPVRWGIYAAQWGDELKERYARLSVSPFLYLPVVDCRKTP